MRTLILAAFALAFGAATASAECNWQQTVANKSTSSTVVAKSDQNGGQSTAAQQKPAS